jgi:YD repeat-containing protein
VTVGGTASNGVTLTVVQSGTIVGQVTAATGGAALVGATVQAVLAGVTKGVATSAVDGSYTIPGLDPGTYDVRVSDSGYSPEVFSGTVVSSNGTTTVNAALSQPGSVDGRITQPDGVTPIVGAAVTAYSGPFSRGSASTNATGDYALTGLHPGAYTIQAANAGSRTGEQGASVVENTVATVNMSLDPDGTDPVGYAYDDLGRLVQVTDRSGDSAIYRYDAVGNITAIDRPGAGGVAISAFTPIAGTTGTTVTINGTGFSTTPGLNTVTFGGVVATVSAATATQIVTSVPGGAGSGTIGVTTPTGSATSSTSFGVLTNGGAPTITGFTPGTGASGAAMTVTGTNFDATAGNDVVRLNVSPVQLTSASATTLQATIPGSGSTGRVSVATANGMASTSNYLWVAPRPYAATDVDSTMTLTVGTPASVSEPTANKITLLAFEGTEGHRASVKVTGVTGSTNVYLYDALGNLVQAATTILSNGLVDVADLRWTATYSVVFDPQSTNPTSGTLTVYDVPADPTGTISPGGAPVTTTITTPGQNGTLTFSGTAGHRVSLQGSNGTIANQVLGCDVNVSILNPDGTVLAAPTCMEVNGFIDATTLPTSGTYTIRIDPVSLATGNLTLTLYDVPTDVSGTITADGTSTVVSITAPGQNAALTFAGTAQQRISLQGSSGTIANQVVGCDVSVSIVRVSDNAVIATGTCMEVSGFIDVKVLPTSDTYKIVVDPAGIATGSLTLQLYTVPSDLSGSLTINNTPTGTSLLTPGQNGAYTLSVPSTQLVTVRLTNNTIAGVLPCVTVSLMNGATTITSSSSCFASFNLTQQNLAAGSYTVKIDPWSSSKGSISVQATSP